MREQIEQIRVLLEELEQSTSGEATAFKESFELFELPELVASVVDYLQPLLTPYEAAMYWHVFRHSIIAKGDVHVRVSTRKLCREVVLSGSGQSKFVSQGKIRDTLSALESKGAIGKMGEANRQGTPYRVYLPEEISACIDAMAARQRAELPDLDPKKELDFYNIKENRVKILERDGYKCQHCGKQLTRFTATLDHLQPVSQHGDNSYENLVTSCLLCNSQRRATPLTDWMARRTGSQRPGDGPAASDAET
jgi:hypothetical protein